MDLEKHLSQIAERLRRVLVERLQVDPNQLVDADAPLVGKGVGLDSMEALELAAGIEQEFAIQVEDADLTAELFRSLASLARYVGEQTAPPG